MNNWIIQIDKLKLRMPYKNNLKEEKDLESNPK